MKLSEGQRVEHEQYGLGVISETDAEYTVIEFDEHGRKKFLTRLVSLETSESSDPTTETESTRTESLEPDASLDRIVSCPHCGRSNRVPAGPPDREVKCRSCKKLLLDDQKPQADESSLVRDRAERLFRFLKELSELRSRMVTRIEDYESVLWLSDIPQHSLCYSVADPSGEDKERDEVWVEIKKPNISSHPPVPKDLKPWIDLTKLEDPTSEPLSLRSSIPAPSESGVGATAVELADHPEIADAWEHYFNEKWTPWANEQIPLVPIQRAYNELFSIYQKQTKLGEAYEVILGVGFLTWKTGGVEIKRHLVAAQASLAFDARRGVIAIGPVLAPFAVDRSPSST